MNFIVKGDAVKGFCSSRFASLVDMSFSKVWRSLGLLTLTFSLAACSTLPATKIPVRNDLGSVELNAAELGALALAGRMNLTLGQSQQVTIYVSGQPAKPGQLIWSTTNVRVVSVTQSGLLKATGVGSATVRAALSTSPSVFLDFPVTVALAAPTPVPTPAPAPAPTASTYVQKVLSLTNAARAVARSCGGVSYAPVPALSLSTQLNAAAQAHASDMASKNYFSHTSQDGRTFDQRVTAAGYLWSAVGENIAAGQPTPEAVVAGWLTSAGHCANIMSANFTQLGVGYASGGSYGSYWVQDFARPR